MYSSSPELLPLISGSAWLITLSSLLIYWLAEGRPRYPLQSNPYVAFISNIGSARLRPLFIVGSLITAFTFIGAVTAVHIDRHNLWRHGRSRASIRPLTSSKLVSGMAILLSFSAGLSLSLLSIFDTFDFHEQHQRLLLSCFLSLAGSACCTSFVCWGYMKKTTKPNRRRRCAIISNAIVLVELLIAIAMTIAGNFFYFRTAGILEWALSIVGVFYIWAFMGFFDPSVKYNREINERSSLLNSQPIGNNGERTCSSSGNGDKDCNSNP